MENDYGCLKFEIKFNLWECRQLKKKNYYYINELDFLLKQLKKKINKNSLYLNEREIRETKSILNVDMFKMTTRKSRTCHILENYLNFCCYLELVFLFNATLKYRYSLFNILILYFGKMYNFETSIF